jgi:putative MFS transporter
VALLSESPDVLPVHRKILAFSFIGWIFDFYDLLLITYVVATTPLKADLGLTDWDFSFVLGTGLACTAIGGLIGGALGDRYGRKPLLIATILIYSLGTAISGMAIGFWSLLIPRAITGLGVGGEWAVAHALVGETVPPHVRGRFGSYLQSGSAFARFFATSVAYLLAPSIGWRWSFILSAVPALIVVFIRRDMPESDIWLKHQRESNDGRRGHLAILTEMVSPALRYTTAVAFTLTFLNMAAYWFKTIWLPTYITVSRGWSLDDSRYLLNMDQLGSLIGYVSFGFAADRFGRRPSFMIYSFIKAIGLLMVTLGWDVAVQYPGGVFVAMFIVGLGEGNWGCIGPLLNEVFPTSVRGAALGIIYNLARGAQFLAPPIITIVAAHASFGAGIALAVPFSILAGLSVWLLPETKGIRLAQRAASPATVASAPTSRR